MKKWYSLLCIIGLITFITLNTFSDNAVVKLVCGVVTVISGVLAGLNHLYGSTKQVRRLKQQLSRNPLLRPMIKADANAAFNSVDEENRVKAVVLQFSIDRCNERMTFIRGSDIFREHVVDDMFIPGTAPVNQTDNWRRHPEEQFVAITGRSGSGKSHELIKRMLYMCDVLTPALKDPGKLTEKRVPLFIELKYLDRELDRLWIAEHIASSMHINDLEMENIGRLIDINRVVYFFDGLDEAPVEYRPSCIELFKELSGPRGAGVHFTCRKGVFDELSKVFPFESSNQPAEFFLQPLSPEWVLENLANLKSVDDAEKAELIAFVRERPTLLKQLSRSIIFNLYVGVYPTLSREEKARLAAAQDEQAVLTSLWQSYENSIAVKKLGPEEDILGFRTYSVWLAKIMGNDPFFVESIQPGWLSVMTDKATTAAVSVQRLYYLTTRVLAAALIGIGFGFLLSTPLALLPTSLLGGAILAGVAGIYKRKSKTESDKPWLPRWLGDGLFTIVLLLSLTVFCGLYQGVVVPRAEADMTTSWFSAPESWSGIMLGVTLSVIFSYRIILEKSRNRYILPIKLFHFNWPHAIGYGFAFGLIAALIAGFVAVAVRMYSRSQFLDQWLLPAIDRLAVRYTGTPVDPEHMNVAVFAYGFGITFLVAFLLISIMAGRYATDADEAKLEEMNDAREKAELEHADIYGYGSAKRTKKAQKKVQTRLLNYGIKRSGRNALVHGLRVALLVACVYTAIMMTSGHEVSWWIAGKIAIGVGILAFLWYGGMEVMNHALLRTNLFARGITPRSYTPWVDAQQRMGLIIPGGHKISFYHRTLADHYRDYEVQNNPRIRTPKAIRIDVRIYWLFVTLCTLYLCYPLVQRYFTDTYWKHGTRLQSRLDGVAKGNDSMYVIQRGGRLILDATGRINVGTFTGNVPPWGTNAGFLGLPLGSTYNVPGTKEFRHGALLVRKRSATTDWSPFTYIATGIFKHTSRLAVNIGDTIQIRVNDKDWQNNSGYFHLNMSVCDTCHN